MTKKSKTTKIEKKVEEQVVKNDQTVQKAEEKVTEEVSTEQETKSTTKRQAKVRGKKYQKARKLIDIKKYYPLKEAISLIKKSSFSKFEGKVEAHLNVFDIGNVGEINFPYLKSTSKKIVILSDKILEEIKNNKINFDVLIATPSTMPKILPLAKILGPKGLMPNPKNGTLTDKPEEAVKKLSVAKTILKTEKKAPVIHIIVGKTSQEDSELIANIEELIKVVKPAKIKKLCLCATMSPSVKIEIK
jgi:large subunit ribosomal protein L1